MVSEVRRGFLAQSAVEYLTIYAWAILLVAVIIAIVVTLALTPSNQQTLAPQCTIQPLLPCHDSVLSVLNSGKSVSYYITFTNGLQKPILIQANGFNVITTGIGVAGTQTSSGTCAPAFALPGTQVICTAQIVGSIVPSIGANENTNFLLNYRICPNDVQSDCAGKPSYQSAGYGLQDVSGPVRFYSVSFVVNDINPATSLTIDNNGIIIFDGQQYTNGETALLPSTGNFPIDVQPPSGFDFSSWSITPPSTVAPGNEPSAAADILANAVITATSNQLLSVPSYYVSVQASPTAGCAVSPVSGLYPKGTVLTINAIANPDYTFTAWVGTGTTSFTGSSQMGSITVNSAITETAGCRYQPLLELGPITPPNTIMDQGQGVVIKSYGASGGTPPYSYQWLEKAPGAPSYTNAVDCTPPATTKTCTVPTSGATTTGMYDFELEATDSASNTATSIPVTIALYPQLVPNYVIYYSPPPQYTANIDSGQSFPINGIVAGGTGNYIYQWFDCYSSTAITPTDPCYAATAGAYAQNTIFSNVIVGYHYLKFSVLDYGVSPWASPSPYVVNTLASSGNYVHVFPALHPAVFPTGSSIPSSGSQQLTAGANGGVGPYFYEWIVTPPANSGVTAFLAQETNGNGFDPSPSNAFTFNLLSIDNTETSDSFSSTSGCGAYAVYTNIQDTGPLPSATPYIDGTTNIATVTVTSCPSGGSGAGPGTEPTCSNEPTIEYKGTQYLGSDVVTACDIKIDSGATLYTNGHSLVAGNAIFDYGTIVTGAPGRNVGGNGGGASYYSCGSGGLSACASASPGADGIGNAGGSAWGGGGGGGGGGGAVSSYPFGACYVAIGGGGGDQAPGGGISGGNACNNGNGGPGAYSGGTGGNGASSPLSSLSDPTIVSYINGWGLGTLYGVLMGAGGGGGGGAAYNLGYPYQLASPGGNGGGGADGLYMQANSIVFGGSADIIAGAAGGATQTGSYSNYAQGGSGGGGGGGAVVITYGPGGESGSPTINNGGESGAAGVSSCCGGALQGASGGNGASGGQASFTYVGNGGPPIAYPLPPLSMPAPTASPPSPVSAGTSVTMSDTGPTDGVGPYTFTWQQATDYGFLGCGSYSSPSSGGSGSAPTNYIFTASPGFDIQGYCIQLTAVDSNGYSAVSETTVMLS